MSAENIEVVRRWLAPISEDLDETRAAVDEFCDADVDYYPVGKFPEARPCHGRGEFSQFLAKFREPWSRFEWSINELIDVGEERVLACLSMRAEGRESAMNLEGDVYQCCWLRHGRFFRLEDHLTLSGALRAFGFEADTLEDAGLRAPSNLDVVRSVITDWERGDYSSADWAHPEIEFVLMGGGPQDGSWSGLAGMAEGWRNWISAWQDFRIAAIDEYREIDAERVLVLHRFSGRGKTSGLEVGQTQTKVASLFHVRNGKVTRLVAYASREAAASDHGLSLEAASGPA